MELDILPHNMEAERAALGCAMVDMSGALQVVQAMEPDDFYHRPHRLIFAAVAALVMRGAQPDHLVVADELGGKLESVGGAEYLYCMERDVPSTANVQEYLDMIRAEADSRDLILVASKAVTDAQNLPYDEARGQMDRALQKIGAVDKLFDTTLEVLATPENSEHFETGLACLDEMTGGLRAGLTLFCGKPGAGKSTLCLQLILRALKTGRKAAILGADQLRSDQAKIIWSSLAGVAVESLTAVDNWADYHKQLTEYPLLWYGGRFSLTAVCAAIRMKATQGVTFFLVDSLQMISVSGKENLSEKQAEASRELKRLSHELGIFVLLTSEYTKLQGTSASIENVRGATGVAHAADIILWLSPLPENNMTGVKKVEVSAFKNKMGVADAKVILTFRGNIHTFTDEGDIPEGV